MQHSSKIVLFQSPPEPCSYLDDHTARNVYADPFRPPTMPLYSALIQKGFRRSGDYLYRPHCEHCEKRISTRIIANDFKPNRSQKRSLKNNSDLTVATESARYTDEYFDMYVRYLDSRHKDAGMDNPERSDFERFLISDWCDTEFCTLRLNGKLLAVAVTDIVSTGLSAVYTYFDPEFEKRSLGTASIMMQMQLASERGLDYVYLGYWIEESSKMNYKSFYKPQERYVNDNWVKVGK